MKSTIKRALNWSLGKLGLELRRATPSDAAGSGDRLIDYLRQLRAFGFEPSVIYDIGANRGLWAAKALRVFPQASYVLFEPQRKLAPDLSRLMDGRPTVTWRQAAVSDTPGTAEFTEMDWDVCSRLSSEMDQAWDVKANRVQVETTTVDEEIRRNGNRPPDLLKIDAEGHDLKVLDGASAALARAEVVMVEGSVNCRTIDNTVRSVINRMAAAGYSLTGIVDLNEFHVPGKSWPGLLWLIDLAFCRTEGALIKKFEDPTAEESPTLASAR